MLAGALRTLFGSGAGPRPQAPDRNRAPLRVEGLEDRVNPSSFWDDTYVGAFLSGLGEGAQNIATGARDAVVETVRTAGDLYTIYTTDVNNLDPSQLNSRLFQAAAQTAGNPEAAAQFDRQLVFGVATLGVGPLVESGYNAVVTGDSTEFSQQAGGFGVMVLVPYGAGRGVGYLRGATAAEAATADATGTVRAGALASVEGEFNPRAVAVRYIEGPVPADADLAVVNQRLALARQILTAEVERLESIDPAVMTQAEHDMLVYLRNASCAEAAVSLERAIATGEVNPLDPAGSFRPLSARDLLYVVDDASAAPPFRGAPTDLPQLLSDQLPFPGSRALVVIERADGQPGHVLNAENVNGTIWLYEAYSGQASPVTGQPPGVVAVEAFYPLEEIAPSGGYSVIVVGP